MINQPILEVTYRQGKPLAAYLYLPRQPGDKSCRTFQFEPGLLIDYAAHDRAIGIEITSPTKVSTDSINRALVSAKHQPVTATDLFPLLPA
jgi:hypothetical protein